MTQYLKLVFGKIENIVGKGENAAQQHFLLFPHDYKRFLFLGRENLAKIIWKKMKFVMLVSITKSCFFFRKIFYCFKDRNQHLSYFQIVKAFILSEYTFLFFIWSGVNSSVSGIGHCMMNDGVSEVMRFPCQCPVALSFSLPWITRKLE